MSFENTISQVTSSELIINRKKGESNLRMWYKSEKSKKKNIKRQAALVVSRSSVQGNILVNEYYKVSIWLLIHNKKQKQK